MAPTRCATGSAVLFLGTVAVLLAAQSAAAAKFDWTNAQYIDALKSIDFQPYTLERHQQTPYNPRTKPWDKVIAAFYTMLSYERRYAAFLIRGIFHDCLAVNTTTCTNPRKPGPGCRGCEGSMMLQDEELGRIENRIKKWGARLSKPLRIICKAFDISMADALAVGAAVAPTFLTHGRVQIVGKGLRVGRLDYLETAPARNLPPPGITTEQFVDFWQKADFSVKEGVALLGSHALLDNNFCQRGLRDFDVCNPEIECCADIKGMRWENHYYHDMCSGGLIITPVNPPVPVYPPKNVTLMTDEEFKAIVKTETCGFTSSDFKDSVRNLMGLVRAGSQQMEEFPASTLINWSQNGCTRSRRYGVRRDECPHPSNWPYTLNDAFNGQVCAEDNDRRKEGRDVKEIRRALREYTDQDEWDRDYTRAYIKMTEAWAHMPNAWTLPSIDPPVGTPSNPDFGLPVKLAEQLKSLEAADA